jgi:antitoxin VapB
MSTSKRAKVFWTGRSQAVRLPKEFRFQGDTVLVRRQGKGIVLEPAAEWPEGYTRSFTGIPADFVRLKQGKQKRREKLA